MFLPVNSQSAQNIIWGLIGFKVGNRAMSSCQHLTPACEICQSLSLIHLRFFSFSPLSRKSSLPVSLITSAYMLNMTNNHCIDWEMLSGLCVLVNHNVLAFSHVVSRVHILESFSDFNLLTGGCYCRCGSTICHDDD